MNIFLNIGSNTGNRSINLSRAVAALEKEFGYFELSHTIETEPWGFESPNRFLNVGMMIISDMPPLQLLKKLQSIEKSFSQAPHRNPDGSYADRMVDIDIIAIDDLVIDTPELSVPHPRMAERLFVLEPFQELAPFWTHPILGKTPGQLISELTSGNLL